VPAKDYRSSKTQTSGEAYYFSEASLRKCWSSTLRTTSRLWKTATQAI